MTKLSGRGLSMDAPSRIELVHPETGLPWRDSDGNPAYIDILSMDSEAARRHRQASTDRRIARRGIKITSAEIEAETIDLLAELTRGWHLVDLDGNIIDLPFSLQNARELYDNAAHPWYREQAMEGAADRARFTKARATS